MRIQIELTSVAFRTALAKRESRDSSWIAICGIAHPAFPPPFLCVWIHHPSIHTMSNSIIRFFIHHSIHARDARIHRGVLLRVQALSGAAGWVDCHFVPF